MLRTHIILAILLSNCAATCSDKDSTYMVPPVVEGASRFVDLATERCDPEASGQNFSIVELIADGGFINRAWDARH